MRAGFASDAAPRRGLERFDLAQRGLGERDAAEGLEAVGVELREQAVQLAG